MAPTHLYTCQSEASGPHFSLFPSSETPTDQSNMLALVQLAAGPRDIADSPPPPHSNLTSHLHHTLSRHRETRSSPVGGRSSSSCQNRQPHPHCARVLFLLPSRSDPCALISSPPACQKPRPVPVPVHALTRAIAGSTSSGSFPRLLKISSRFPAQKQGEENLPRPHVPLHFPVTARLSSPSTGKRF